MSLYLSLPWSWVHTVHCIYRVQHPPKTACVRFIVTITWWLMEQASAFAVPPYTIDHDQPSLHETLIVMSPYHMPAVASQLTDQLSVSTMHTSHRPPSDWPPPTTYPISLDYGLPLHLATRPITATKCIPNLPQLQPPRQHDHALQVQLQTCLIMASKFARSWPLGASWNLLDRSLQVHL